MEAKSIRAIQAPSQVEGSGTIVLLPSPGFLGHFIPFVELARKLVNFHHNCVVTLIIPNDGTSMNHQRSLLQSIPNTINSIFLPPVSTDDLSENDANTPEILMTTRIIRCLPSLRSALSSLASPATAVVVDMFAPHAIEVAREFSVPAYIYYTTSALELSISMDLPKLATYICTSQWIDMCKMYRLADGILVNSFLELEPEAFHDLEQLTRISTPRVYPVGPLIRTGLSETELEQGSECLKWVNDQPPQSVLFVSFGSGAALSVEQFRELAYGLEMSEQRFVWVVKRPQENIVAAYLRTSTDEKDPLDFLPEGFLERTKGRGLVVASWVPQTEVLSYASTGGFVTQCGWNSILESVVFGVPLIAWPLCFEQSSNAQVVTDQLKVAIRVNDNENRMVERGRISQVVKQLMQGEEGKNIRNRMMDLKIAAGNALSKEGSSTQALAQVVHNLVGIFK